MDTSLSFSRLLSSSTTTSLLSPKTKTLSSNFTLPLKLNRFNPKPLRFSTSSKISATISVGDKLPESTFSYLDPAGEVQTITVSDLTKGKKAVLFAVPGAFTPTCSQKHCQLIMCDCSSLIGCFRFVFQKLCARKLILIMGILCGFVSSNWAESVIQFDFEMATQFDMLCDVLPGHNSWKFKVRVLRMWAISSFMKPNELNSMEMVLIDGNGVYSLIHGKHSNSVVVTDITPFDRFYPHKTVREFIDTQESGFFVLCARVVGIFHINKWWYPVCKCGNFLDIWVGCYFCVQCNIHVFCVSSMFKLQIAIDDGTSTVLIQSTHSPLRGIHCLNHSSLGIEHALAHYGSKAFEGKEILFIARKTSRSEYRFEDYVEIINMTDEEGSVRRFHELGNNFTPTKSIYIDPFAQLDVEAHDSVLVSSVQKFITKGKKPLIDLETPSNFSCVTTGSFSTSNLIKARKKLSYAFSECTGERNIFEC
ncbi:uncharacterized protein LOC123895755 [Trifolium pratense]|nr:uncharacterized protein LOC123895755 [Trifolium pratense]